MQFESLKQRLHEALDTHYAKDALNCINYEKKITTLGSYKENDIIFDDKTIRKKTKTSAYSNETENKNKFRVIEITNPLLNPLFNNIKTCKVGYNKKGVDGLITKKDFLYLSAHRKHVKLHALK